MSAFARYEIGYVTALERELTALRRVAEAADDLMTPSTVLGRSKVQIASRLRDALTDWKATR